MSASRSGSASLHWAVARQHGARNSEHPSGAVRCQHPCKRRSKVKRAIASSHAGRSASPLPSAMAPDPTCGAHSAGPWPSQSGETPSAPYIGRCECRGDATAPCSTLAPVHAGLAGSIRRARGEGSGETNYAPATSGSTASSSSAARASPSRPAIGPVKRERPTKRLPPRPALQRRPRHSPTDPLVVDGQSAASFPTDQPHGGGTRTCFGSRTRCDGRPSDWEACFAARLRPAVLGRLARRTRCRRCGRARGGLRMRVRR